MAIRKSETRNERPENAAAAPNAGSASASAYNASAQAKEDERAAFARKVVFGRVAIAAVAALLAVLDIALYITPFTKVGYDAEPLFVAIQCFFCSVLPILLAMLCANALLDFRFEDGKSRKASALVAAAAFAGAAALLAAGWVVRSNSYADGSGVDWMLNFTAVAAALLAGIVHYALDRRCRLWAAKRDEAAAERDVLQRLDYLSQFRTASEKDAVRRGMDTAAYLEQVDAVVDAGLCAKDAARTAIAQKVAKTPDQRMHVMGTPFRIGAEDVSGSSRAQVHGEVSRRIGAPTPEDAWGDWHGPSCNTEYFDLGQVDAVEGFAKRLERVQNISAADASGAMGAAGSTSSESGTERPIEVEPVYEPDCAPAYAN